MKNVIVVIAGPTASGKSGLALDVAEAFGGAVVNADSMQVYDDTPLLSACPSDDDKKRVPHYLYQMWPAAKNGSVVDWLNEAEKVIRLLWFQEKIPVVVGGTGLYLDNLINGTTPIPETSSEVRLKVAQILNEKGVNGLHQMLAVYDEETAQRLSPNDTTRVRRAMEVFYDTGKPLSYWHSLPKIKRLPEACFFSVKLVPSIRELEENCSVRFDKMIEQGALDEVKKLSALQLNEKLPAMHALGVPELLRFVRQEISLQEAVALAKLHTRQYAKRQRTWFNNQMLADVLFEHCYRGEKELLENLIEGVKKLL